ncbi:sugar ABC transporter ATP-binding protein [Streptomyces sp. NPDC090994]|uniref:sugar ABC transporter ATP-binding protein n=1 Tax=Streptomyces sp. NPDC090994 TaxID=3365969 RepID=UPI0037F4DC2E
MTADGTGQPTPTPPASLRLRGVSKTFDGVRVLHGLDLTVSRGTFHALAGGNGSGKSTTLKILAGIHHADPGGTVAVGGVSVDAARWDASTAHRAGLRFVHQDLGLVDDLTIAENFALVGGFPRLAAGINWSRLHRATGRALERAGLSLDPRTTVGRLRPGMKTLVAIARATGADEPTGAEILVLDEPTASLPRHEADLLLRALRERRDAGATIVYVSHRIPEILACADDLSVLRDGRLVHSGPNTGLAEPDVIELMTGAAEPSAAPGERPSRSRGAPVLRTHDATGPGWGPCSLTAHAGEIVGVAGTLGSGRSRMLRTLAGRLPLTGGRIEVRGTPRRHRTVGEAIAAGIVYVSEDRARESAFPDRPLWENISCAVLGAYTRPWGVDRRRERRDAVERADAFGVRAGHASVPFTALSGGNQQKAVIARATWPRPAALLLDEPTQGVDAAARRDIHAHVRAHVAGGATAIVVSSDFVELAALCDRVLVLHDGVPVGEIEGGALSESTIAQAVLAAGRVPTS